MYLMKFGTVTIVISVLFIQFSLLFTSYHMNSDYFLISIFLILFSSLVWGIYIRQNYQIIAFAFMPLLLNAHQHDFIFLEIVFSFLICFFSISIFVASTFILGVDYLFKYEFLNLFVFTPSICWFIFKVSSSFEEKNIFKNLIKTAQQIGISKKDVKYKRRTFYFHNYDIYNYVLLISLLIIFSIDNGFIPYILGLLLLYTINKATRFLDDETIFTSLFILISFIIPNYEMNSISISLIFLLLNPFPFLIVYPYCKHDFDEIPVVKPFNMKEIYDATKSFLSKIDSNDPLLICYSDPNNNYSKCFDGYGYHYILLIHYIRNRSHAPVLPDWFSIYEESKNNDLSLWGLSEHEVVKNLKKINSKYFLHINDGRDNCKWLKNSKSYRLISKIDTNQFQNSFEGINWPNENPKFELYSYIDKDNLGFKTSAVLN